MRVVKFTELVELPAGTIFCSLSERYADNLYRKGETGWDRGEPGGERGRGFWKTELLPQVTCATGYGNGPAWQPETWWPSNYDKDAVFYTLDSLDVQNLIEQLSGKPSS